MHSLDDAQDEVRGGDSLCALRLLELAQLLHLWGDETAIGSLR